MRITMGGHRKCPQCGAGRVTRSGQLVRAFACGRCGASFLGMRLVGLRVVWRIRLPTDGPRVDEQ